VNATGSRKKTGRSLGSRQEYTVIPFPESQRSELSFAKPVLVRGHLSDWLDTVGASAVHMYSSVSCLNLPLVADITPSIFAHSTSRSVHGLLTVVQREWITVTLHGY